MRMSDKREFMAGKRVVITGANSGIGFETACELAAMGAEIVMVCRDPQRAEPALRHIRGVSSGPADPTLLFADLSRQSEIRALAETIKERFGFIDVLINNAGGVSSKREMTADGVERTFAVNHLAPFLLTNLLLDQLKAAPQGRVVTVSSEAHAGKFQLDNLQGERSYQFFKNYAISKTANVLFTYELARRLKGTAVTANVVSPGPSRTRFGDNMSGAAGLFPKLMKRMPFFHSAVKGAEVVVWAASEPSLADQSGRFYMKNKERKSKKVTYDEALAGQLWTMSELLSGLAVSDETVAA
jgi:retinol dehydrogenase-14